MPIGAINAAVSGLSAEAARLRVSAHNVANINTDGFEARRAVLESQRDGGVRLSRIETASQPGRAISDAAGTRRASNVSLEDEVATEITARTAYRADARVLRTAEETIGSLFDILV